MGFDCHGIDNNHDPVYADNFESSVRGRARILYLSVHIHQTTSCHQLIVFGAPRLSSWLATSTPSEAPPSQIMILSISLKAQLPDNHCPIRLWVSLLFGFETSSTDLLSVPTFPVPPNRSVDVAESAQSTVSKFKHTSTRCHAYLFAAFSRWRLHLLFISHPPKQGNCRFPCCLFVSLI